MKIILDTVVLGNLVRQWHWSVGTDTNRHRPALCRLVSDRHGTGSCNMNGNKKYLVLTAKKKVIKVVKYRRIFLNILLINSFQYCAGACAMPVPRQDRNLFCSNSKKKSEVVNVKAEISKFLVKSS